MLPGFFLEFSSRENVFFSGFFSSFVEFFRRSRKSSAGGGDVEEFNKFFLF